VQAVEGRGAAVLGNHQDCMAMLVLVAKSVVGVVIVPLGHPVLWAD